MTDSLLLLKEENKRLSQLAEKDWLTGLCNRMAAEKRINDWLKTRKAGTLFVLDVDNFKSINDRYGYIAGDKVLQGIADILTLISFSTDIIGRVGGDEFIVFMPASQKPDFIEVRCRLMEMLHECIQLSLRSGDVFTRYSSCQFLVMVSDVTNTETNTIAERIRESFGHCLAVTMQPYRLTFNQYPLKPAFSKNCCL